MRLVKKMKRLSAWVPETDLVTLAVLGKFSEELGELQAVLGRITIQGFNGPCKLQNRERLEDEIADVLNCIVLTINHFNLDFIFIRARQKVKNEHKIRWHQLLQNVTAKTVKRETVKQNNSHTKTTKRKSK